MKKLYKTPKIKAIRIEQELLNTPSLYNEKGGPAEARRHQSIMFDDDELEG